MGRDNVFTLILKYLLPAVSLPVKTTNLEFLEKMIPAQTDATMKNGM